MERKRNNKFGFSLAEISLAVLIFALCAIPLYYAISYGSSEEIQLEKRTIANKLLESFRDEMKNLDFDTAKEYMNIDVNSLPPETFNEYLKAAKNYKDYKFSTKSSSLSETAGIESINFKAEVSWTTGSGRVASQTISFVKVK